MKIPKRQIATAAGIILFGTIIGKIAGFIREILIAKYFGASLSTDAYFVAYNIPMLLIAIILGGGGYSALVPIFTKYIMAKENKIVWRLSSIIISYTIVISCGLIVGILIFAPYLVKFLGYGLGQEAYELAIKLTRVMSPIIIFTGLTSVLIGILHSYQHFTIPSFNAFILGTTVIVSIISLYKNLGIYSVAIGLVVGSGLMFLASLIVSFKKEIKYSFDLNTRYPEVKEFMHLFIPATAGTIMGSSYTIVTRMMASPLPEGSISALDFANMIMQTPLSTFSLAISTAVFPFIASCAATGDYEGLKGIMSKGIRMTTLIYIPIGLIFMVLCQPIIRLLFERGNFDSHDTMVTSSALFFYAIGIIGVAVNYILVRVFYAIQDAITPLWVTMVGILVNIVLNFLLIKYFAHVGIAFSTSISYLVTTFILFGCLRRRIGHIDTKKILNSFLKMIGASLPGILVCFLISQYLEGILDISRIEFQIIQVGTATTIGLICYIIILWFLKADELKMIVELLPSRFKARERL